MYVVGFIFLTLPYERSGHHGDHVLLIRKNRPEWQAGRLNGIGGHIEPGEKPLTAMVRETEEEAGLKITTWQHTATLTATHHYYHNPQDSLAKPFLYVFSADLRKRPPPLWQSLTDETIEAIPVRDVFYFNPYVLPNLPLLISLALDTSGIVKPVTFYDPIKS